MRIVKLWEIQFPEERRRRQDQLDLRQVGRLAQNIDITLHKLAETPSLRSVRAPYISHLQRLKRSRQAHLHGLHSSGRAARSES